MGACRWLRGVTLVLVGVEVRVRVLERVRVGMVGRLRGVRRGIEWR